MNTMKRAPSDRGTHTTYIELANDVVVFIAKEFTSTSFSPGKITQGIGAKQSKITLAPELGFVVMTVIMKRAKQEVRIFSVDAHKLFRVLKKTYHGSVLVQINI